MKMDSFLNYVAPRMSLFSKTSESNSQDSGQWISGTLLTIQISKALGLFFGQQKELKSTVFF